MRVAMAYLFVMTFGWGLGAWLAIALDQIVRAMVIYSRFKSGKWKYFRIVECKLSYLADTEPKK